MLTELRIENFAIIDRLELSLGSGLLTFTGETGAGKSIILDAIMAVVGGKTDPTAIRAGAERASVEATFRLPATTRDQIRAILEREDLLDDPETVTLAREIRPGRSVARVNGRSVALSLMRELGAYLVDIHGQSEHLSLLNVRAHLGLLDRYADIDGLLAPYREAYHQLMTLRRELRALREAEQELSRRADLMAFQAQEIEAAHLLPGEEADLKRERDRLANAETLASLSQQALTLLEEGSPENPPVSDALGQVVQALAGLSKIDPSQEHLREQAEEIEQSLAEIALNLRDYMEKIEFNPRRLEQVEERLDLIHSLKRKYGGSIEAVIQFGKETRAKMETLASSGERIAEMEADERVLLSKLAELAKALSERRAKAAEKLAAAMEAELDDLRMAGARVAVELTTQPDPRGLPLEGDRRVAFDANGFDRAEFLIAPNLGEGLKPLVKIASGGETSRLMLALKNVLAKADDIPTLIFDEIDQGIGGRVGTVVGEKLWQLGRNHQVLCVTHLPQLAAFGDQHFRVQKAVEGGRTTTQVERLEGGALLDELAQMLGNLSEASRSAAQEALEMARQRSQELAQIK